MGKLLQMRFPVVAEYLPESRQTGIRFCIIVACSATLGGKNAI
jgi:hypothetical protein